MLNAKNRFLKVARHNLHNHQLLLALWFQSLAAIDHKRIRQCNANKLCTITILVYLFIIYKMVYRNIKYILQLNVNIYRYGIL